MWESGLKDYLRSCGRLANFQDLYRMGLLFSLFYKIASISTGWSTESGAGL